MTTPDPWQPIATAPRDGTIIFARRVDRELELEALIAEAYDNFETHGEILLGTRDRMSVVADQFYARQKPTT